MGHHRWSGWPGAYCMYCGAEHRMEIAIANCYFDPYTETWDTPEHEKEYQETDCPIVPDGVSPYSLPYPLKDEEV